MLPKTAKDTKDSQSRLDFFLMWSPFPVIIPSHIIPGLGQGCFGFFQCILHTFFELINRLKVRLGLVRFKAHMGYLSSVQEERGLLGCRVYMIMMYIKILQVEGVQPSCPAKVFTLPHLFQRDSGWNSRLQPEFPESSWYFFGCNCP